MTGLPALMLEVALINVHMNSVCTLFSPLPPEKAAAWDIKSSEG